MSDLFHKFPSTPHLAWLGSGDVREDKILPPHEVSDFLSNSLEVEEKIDGANLGISFDSQGTMRFQNRGNWLEGKLTGQWERLRGWSANHEVSLRRLLPAHHVLFGEWCYARHSVHYDQLPDWFIGFDVYDGKMERFWRAKRRNELLLQAGLSVVPNAGRGNFILPELIDLLDGPSQFGTERREGIYLRIEDDEWLTSRAKIVRPEFIQQIGEHWSKGALLSNSLLKPPLA